MKQTEQEGASTPPKEQDSEVKTKKPLVKKPATIDLEEEEEKLRKEQELKRNEDMKQLMQETPTEPLPNETKTDNTILKKNSPNIRAPIQTKTIKTPKTVSIPDLQEDMKQIMNQKEHVPEEISPRSLDGPTRLTPRSRNLSASATKPNPRSPTGVSRPVIPTIK